QACHVRTKRSWDGDRAVLVLIVLHDGKQEPPDGDARAIEGVNELSPLAAAWPVPCIHATRLEVSAVRTAGDFAIGLLTRQPDFDVVGLASTETHVAAA